MPGRLDLAFASLFVVVSILENIYFWPRFRADSDADRPRTRPRAYRRVILGEWLITLAAIAIWAGNGRSWSAMSLSFPHGWRLALGITLNGVMVVLLLLQRASVVRLSVAKRVAVRPKLAAVAFMLPRTREEQFWFVTLAVTAGFCEELLCRGYLPWVFAPWLGPLGGMGVAVLIFGMSHIYQGPGGAVKATIVGAVMAAVVLATRSLIPAMVLHALIDFEGVTVGYLFMSDDSSSDSTPGSGAQAAEPVGAAPAK